MQQREGGLHSEGLFGMTSELNLCFFLSFLSSKLHMLLLCASLHDVYCHIMHELLRLLRFYVAPYRRGKVGVSQVLGPIFMLII